MLDILYLALVYLTSNTDGSKTQYGARFAERGSAHIRNLCYTLVFLYLTIPLGHSQMILQWTDKDTSRYISLHSASSVPAPDSNFKLQEDPETEGDENIQHNIVSDLFILNSYYNNRCWSSSLQEMIRKGITHMNNKPSVDKTRCASLLFRWLKIAYLVIFEIIKLLPVIPVSKTNCP